MVDAPVSGTGAQAKVKDIVVMSSGDKSIVDECDDIFRSFSKQNIYVGDFGNGIKFKILANLLVTVHNTVTAEALLLGQKAGLEEKMIYEVSMSQKNDYILLSILMTTFTIVIIIIINICLICNRKEIYVRADNVETQPFSPRNKIMTGSA